MNQVCNDFKETMVKLKHYRFMDLSLASDTINTSGKVIRYKEVNVLEYSEEKARMKSKIDEGYTLIGVYELGKDWD